MRSSTAKPLAWDGVVERAERREGLVRRSDLIALGYHQRQIRRLVLNGRLLELHRDVYALGHRALSCRAQFLAAVWWAGKDAALSHHSAAAFYGWIKEDASARLSVHVTVRGNGVRSKPGVRVHRTRHLDHHDVMRYGDLRVTDRVRTLVDLADHLTYAELRAVADELPSLPKQRLIATAKRLPGRAGAGRIQRLIHSENAHARFEMERRSVRYFAQYGVPAPDGRNVRIHGLLVDCWYAAAKLVVELDSRAHHTRRAEFEADRLRDRALKRHGVDTLRLVWHDLDPEDALAARDILQRLAPSDHQP